MIALYEPVIVPAQSSNNAKSDEKKAKEREWRLWI